MTIILGHSKILPNYPINKRALIVQETFKMIMKHASLKEIDIKTTFSFLTINVPYITFPGANLCFQNLCKFVGDSSTNSEFCSRLADICKDIKKFKMEIAEDINEGMKKFISVQRNIKEFDILLHNNRCTNIVPTLMNIADTLIKLNFEGLMFCPNMTFISKFINLRELSIILSYDHENLSALQYVTLPQLKRLSLKGAGIPRDYLSRFLENHGRNLDKLTCDNTLNSVIINYCPKLNFLCTSFYEETELRFLLKNCEKLTTLEVDCYQSSLNESRVLASVAEVGASTLAELRINKNTIQRDAQIFSDLSEDINWGERIAPISIILNVEEGSRTSDQGRLMIEKYISLDKIKSYEEISLPMDIRTLTAETLTTPFYTKWQSTLRELLTLSILVHNLR
ncbi:15952_t:CDS:2 [Funneliformis geosporum]|nr:15952_t:CDS:2 [Funneliformis geosporum]